MPSTKKGARRKCKVDAGGHQDLTGRRSRAQSGKKRYSVRAAMSEVGDRGQGKPNPRRGRESGIGQAGR